jgi:hypothetical protein
MLPRMSTWKLAFAIAAMTLAGCGSRQGNAEAPGLPAPETVDDTTSDPEPAEPSESTESESAESTESEPAAEAAPARKACSDLPKSTCQVTEGCAWSTNKKCVDQ